MNARVKHMEPIGVVLPKLPTPFPDGFVGHGDAAFAQEFLHVAVAQGEPIIQPDPVADDCTGKAVVLVTRGVGRRGHAWGPILGCMCSLRGHRRGDDVTAEKGWSTSGPYPCETVRVRRPGDRCREMAALHIQDVTRGWPSSSARPVGQRRNWTGSPSGAGGSHDTPKPCVMS
jgi:hypothetical protein